MTILLGKHVPIEELEAHFASEGTSDVNAACSREMSFSAAEWNSMTEKERADVLMNYRIAYLGETSVNWCPKLGTVSG